MIPKGWPIKGLKAAKSAAREAYEEAGEIIAPRAVRVFPLLVKRQDKTWPEYRQRQSQWFVPEEALSVIKEESLRVLISSFVGSLVASASP